MKQDALEGARLRPATTADGQALARIYNHYVRETIVTFEEAEVSAAQMGARVEETQAAALPWLVAERAGQLLGFAQASRWKGRCAYRHSVEVSVYVDRDHAREGLGSLLYSALIEDLRTRGAHTLIGGIALPNPASVALHERFGFVQVAHFREVGRKFERWIDVGYWQRTE